MTGLLTRLEAFNRKERFFVFAQATDNPRFTLGAEFRAELGSKLGIEIPENASAYVDYHLDWLHAAIVLDREPEDAEFRQNRTPEGAKIVSTGNQEDIDLLDAFDGGPSTFLILVEAKAFSPWLRSQMDSKSKRLAMLFGCEETAADAAIQPRFCVLSPTEPTAGALGAETWPKWMLLSDSESSLRFAWLELRVPRGRMRVQGLNDAGKPSHERTRWRALSIIASDSD